MAKQIGSIKFVGKLGELQGRRQPDGTYTVQLIGGPTSEEVKNGVHYLNLRKNNEEFKTAVAWATGLRNATRRVLFSCCQQVRVRSLGLTFLRNIKRNKVGAWGERDLDCDNLELQMSNFDFSDNGKFDTTFMRGTDIDFTPQGAIIWIARHDSETDINQPQAATHYSFAAACVMRSEKRFQFEAKQVFEHDTETESNPFDPRNMHQINNGIVNKLSINIPDPENGVGGMKMYIIAIHFWTLQNGSWIAVKGGRSNMAKVITITQNGQS